MNVNILPTWLFNVSSRIIEHMNDIHSNSIASALNVQHGIKDRNAKMEKLEVDSYFESSKEQSYFLKF